MAFGSNATPLTHCGASEHVRSDTQFVSLLPMHFGRSGLRSLSLIFAWLLFMPRWQHIRLNQLSRSRS